MGQGTDSLTRSFFPDTVLVPIPMVHSATSIYNSTIRIQHA